MDLSTILQNFLDETKKLTAFPSKRKMKIYALFYIAAQFENKKQYTEKEVNEIINNITAFKDPATIRRELYNNRFIDRKLDCSYYWLEEKQPTLADFGLKEK